MSKRLSYERYLWFHQRLKKNTFPRLKDLMEAFEISQRQAAREIEYMRLFLHAPLEYSTVHRGYFYSDDRFELPGPMVSEEEIISLVIAKRLSVTIPDQRRKQQLHDFFKSLSNYLQLDLAGLEEKISLKNVRYARVNPDVFDGVLQALTRNKKLAITYRSVHTKESLRRVINPLHLVLYMGNWHLLAFCQTRKGVRDFALSRIRDIEVCAEEIEAPFHSMDIKKEIDGVHGIFFEGRKEPVVLRFNEKVADYVREQVWFPGQILSSESTGHVTLRFFVTDLREVVREVLSFGADVEVVEPETLRDMIKEKIRQLTRLYDI
jgi:predicted DNA-binding transcriptional regulator YafY